jgi:hypothetical protein
VAEPGSEDRKTGIGNTRADRSGQFLVQPNPGSEQILLTYLGDPADQANLRVVSATGQLMSSMILEAVVNGGQYPLDAHDWPAGVYFLQLQANGLARYRLWEKL